MYMVQFMHLNQWSSTFFVQSPPTRTLLKNRPHQLFQCWLKHYFNLKTFQC